MKPISKLPSHYKDGRKLLVKVPYTIDLMIVICTEKNFYRAGSFYMSSGSVEHPTHFIELPEL